MRFFLVLLVMILAGCANHPAPVTLNAAVEPTDTLAPGVVHHAVANADGTGIDVIDIDLTAASVHPVIAALGIRRELGTVVGQAFSPRQWLARTHALAAINGGYFGQETAAGQKEIVGLLVQKGRVRRMSPPLYGRGGAFTTRGYYVRSAFGLTADGTPTIVWAATDPANAQSLLAFHSPMSRAGSRWRVDSAVGCGPMLVYHGKAIVTDYAERLVSSGPQARTFLAYDTSAGQPRHLLLGMASGITFHDLAAFALAYFPRYDHTRAAAAMCLDGGSSAQMSYRRGRELQSPRDTDVAVPDAVLLLPNP